MVMELETKVGIRSPARALLATEPRIIDPVLLNQLETVGLAS
jgi:hypothetical protein